MTSTVVVPNPTLPASELALNPATGDLLLPVQILRGPQAVAQRIRCRFRFFLGEWFLDLRLGVPYYQAILVKNPDVSIINAIFTQVLAKTPGVAAVSFLSVSLDSRTRSATIAFQCTLTDGSTLTFTDDPFIITAGQ